MRTFLTHDTSREATAAKDNFENALEMVHHYRKTLLEDRRQVELTALSLAKAELALVRAAIQIKALATKVVAAPDAVLS